MLETVGDDALFLPAVDFGNGPAIGAGSWQFGVSATRQEPEGATEFIMYTMEPENVAMVSEVSSLVPATAEGAALTEKFAEGGIFRPFYDMSEAFAIIRPPTPGYLKLSSEFERALIKIRDGENVQDALDDAVANPLVDWELYPDLVTVQEPDLATPVGEVRWAFRFGPTVN